MNTLTPDAFAQWADQHQRFPDIVARPSLVQQMHQATKAKFTVVVAPAGYGKSALIEQWAAEAADAPITSLQFGSLGLAEPLTGFESGVLVVDGCDSLDDTESIQQFESFVAGCPPSLRFVVAGRVELPLLLALRSASPHELTYIGQPELALDKYATRLLVENIVGAPVADLKVDELWNRTQGWPAGVYLAALAIRDEQGVSPAAEKLTDVRAYVDDYFDEVLAAQPEPVRRFLVETSVLETQSAHLCDAITGRTDGQAMLIYLERHSVFVNRTSGDDETFEYLPIFREFLQGRLPLSAYRTESELLNRAADWCLEQDDVETAGAYLVQAGEWERVVDVVSHNARSMFDTGRAVVLLGLLKSVPFAVRATRRDVTLQKGALESLTGNTLAAEATLGPLSLSEPLSPGEQFLVDGLRATWIEQHAGIDTTIHAAAAVLEASTQLSPGDIPFVFDDAFTSTFPCRARRALGRALWLRGDVAMSREVLTTAVEESADSPYSLTSALGALALVEAWAGKLSVAHDTAEKGLDIARQAGWLDRACSANSLLALASVARERGELVDAAALLDLAAVAVDDAKQAKASAVLASERAMLDLAMSNSGVGLVHLVAFQTSLEQDPPRLVADRLRAAEARLWLMSGDVATAAQLVDKLMPIHDELRAAAIEIAVFQQDVHRARHLLSEWPSSGEPRQQLLYGLWTAIVDDLDGQHGQARRRIDDVVSAAKADNYVQMFLDAGHNASKLLRAANRARPSEYLSFLAGVGERSADTGVASLSERELMVLRLLPSSLSNVEIAAQLFVSLNTVKTHLRSVYRHLGVHGRQEAVAKAEQLGII